MKADEIKIDSYYMATIRGKSCRVRVNGIEDRPFGYGKPHTAYHVTVMDTGNRVILRSANAFTVEMGRPVSEIKWGGS